MLTAGAYLSLAYAEQRNLLIILGTQTIMTVENIGIIKEEMEDKQFCIPESFNSNFLYQHFD